MKARDVVSGIVCIILLVASFSPMVLHVQKAPPEAPTKTSAPGKNLPKAPDMTKRIGKTR